MSTFCWWTTSVPHESQRDASRAAAPHGGAAAVGASDRARQRSPACRNRRSGRAPDLAIFGRLVVDIGIPDYETRVAILRRKAEERGSKFQPGVLETIAKVEYPNVRELMGALNRLIAFQAVNDSPINAEAASKYWVFLPPLHLASLLLASPP